MLTVNHQIQIPDDELSFTYARSGGPGGQNVNKVASKAVLRWSLAQSRSVPDDVKVRFRTLFPSRLTVEGDVVIHSQEFRDQERNRQACLEKLGELLRLATRKPKVRRPTRPSRGSKERRLAAKRERSARKSGRGRIGEE